MVHRLSSEFVGIELGDKRLNARAQAIVEVLGADPSLSFPRAFGGGTAELEGVYRFFENGRVTAEALIQPHFKETHQRCLSHGTVLVVHDTTTMSFGHGRTGLAKLQENVKERGFYCHASLAVSADGSREPLGVVGLQTFERKTVGPRSSKERRKDDDRESKRWLTQSIEVEGRLPKVSAVHVEDREADIFESLTTRVEKKMRFVVRAQHHRAVLDDDDEAHKIDAFLREQPRRMTRVVPLSRRDGPPASKRRKANPPREAREATLAIAAVQITLRRPRDDGADVRKSLVLNAVHVLEVNPPEGEAAVEWILFTTEPIETDKQIEFIIDSYRARWMIEEYFKALKTGCSYEARQFETYDALLRVLGMFAVLAWNLLLLRHRERNNDTSPAPISPDQLAILKARRLVTTDIPSSAEVLGAIAKLGGHIKWNGAPGWQVLWRGYRRLCDLAEGFQVARSDQW